MSPGLSPDCQRPPSPGCSLLIIICARGRSMAGSVSHTSNMAGSRPPTRWHKLTTAARGDNNTQTNDDNNTQTNDNNTEARLQHTCTDNSTHTHTLKINKRLMRVLSQTGYNAINGVCAFGNAEETGCFLCVCPRFCFLSLHLQVSLANRIHTRAHMQTYILAHKHAHSHKQTRT